MSRPVTPVFYGILLLLVSFLPLASQGAEFRAWWVDTWSPAMMNEDQISQLVADARAGNFNALIVEVRRRGDAFYNSKLEPKIAGVAPGFDPLADLLAKAHDTRNGPRLQVHCWLVTYPMANGTNQPPQPDHPLNLHPDWLNRTTTGAITDGHGYYFDPGHPGVQQHTFDVAMDLLTRYDIDGINWDYIRYPGNQWGYNPVTVARFNSRFGRTGQPAKDDPDWMQFRRDQITALLRKVYLSALAIKPHLIHSADTFSVKPNSNKESPWLGSGAYRSVLQDWRAWMEEGIIDLNVPMTYMDHDVESKNYVFSSNFTKNHRYNRFALIGPSLYQNTISNSIVQMRHTREATPEGHRAEGVACYSYAAISKERISRSEFIQALTQPTPHDPIQPPVFAKPVSPPVIPWKIAPTNGHLKGFVRDDISAGLDGAMITLDGPVKRKLLSDATGFYGSVDLPSGRYRVTALFPGFQELSKTVSIFKGAVTDADFSLNPSGIAIVLQPQDQIAIAGANTELSTRVAGLKPFKYQWLLNNTVVEGATNETLVLTNVQPHQAGKYRLAASNVSGSTTSAVAELKCEFTLRGSADDYGTLVFFPKRQSYPAGAKVIIAARPEAGFDFSHWSGGIMHSNNPFQLTVSSNLSFNAHFIQSVQDLIVDNPDATFTGRWAVAATSSDRYSADYRFIPNVSGSPNASATYRPAIKTAGNYDVFTWYPQGGNRSTNALFVISNSGGAVTSSVNQTTGGGGWRLIAKSKPFEAGTNGFVQLLNNGADEGRLIMADALRFTWSKTQKPPALEQARSTLPENSFLLADFETNKPGSIVLFHPSATTADFFDRQNPPSARVTNQLPAGNPSSQALLVKMTFSTTNAAKAWLRLTTHEAPVRPNPTVQFDSTIAFAARADRPLYISLGLRETDSTAGIGANGGSDGLIEWIGGVSDNTTTPPKGHFLPAGEWVWMEYFIPTEPIRAFTGDGTLESATGKGVMEELAIVPADGPGTYNLYLDDFHSIELKMKEVSSRRRLK